MFGLGLLKGTQTYTEGSKSDIVEIVSTDWKPVVEVVVKNKNNIEKNIINLFEFISVKGIKAIGNQLSKKEIKEVNLLDPIPYTPEVLDIKEIEVIDVDDQTQKADENKENDNNQIQLEF